MRVRIRCRFWAAVVISGLLGGCATQSQLDAIASADKVAEKSNADEPDSLTRLASDIEAHGQIDTALPLYERATAVSSDATAAQMRLGDAYMRAGRAAEAAKAYRAALDSAPDNTDALLGLGSALVKAGDPDGAIAPLAKAAPLVNTMTAYNRLGVAQTLAGSLRDAQASFDAASALAPDDLDVRTNLALAAALDGQALRAIEVTRAVVASPAAEPRHRRNLVIVFGLLGRADEGRAEAPPELSASEVKSLLARANSIRAMSSAKARAKALGTIVG